MSWVWWEHFEMYKSIELCAFQHVCMIECNTCTIPALFFCALPKWSWQYDWVAARPLCTVLMSLIHLVEASHSALWPQSCYLKLCLSKTTAKDNTQGSICIFSHSAYLSSALQKNNPGFEQEKQTKYCWLKFLWIFFSEHHFVSTQIVRDVCVFVCILL